MTSDKTKQKTTNSKTPEKKSIKNPKKKEPVPLDDNILMLARELFKHISPLSLDINSHHNKKTIIINEDELNSFLEINIKIAQINEVKKMHLSLLDNDLIEIEMEIVNFSSNSDVIKQLKIEEGLFNEEEGYIRLKTTDESVHKGNYAANRIMLLVTKYILKMLLIPDLMKLLKEDKITVENEIVTIDIKNGSFKSFYDKTINQLLNTSVPYFGTKHLMELIEIESIMCEKGQLWIDFVYKIV